MSYLHISKEHGGNILGHQGYYKICWIVLFFSWLSSYSIVTLATQTSVNQTASASINGSAVEIELIFSNQGNNALFNLSSRVFALGVNKLQPSLATLPANKSFNQSITLNMDEKIEGEVSILCLTNYHDHQGFLHTIITQLYLSTVAINENLLNLSIIVQNNERTESRYSLQIENNSGDLVAVDLQLITPEGIATNRLVKTIQIEGNTKQSLPIVLNAANLVKYTEYSVYVIANFKKSDIQYSKILSAPINNISDVDIVSAFFSYKEGVYFLFAILLLTLLFTTTKNISLRNKT